MFTHNSCCHLPRRQRYRDLREWLQGGQMRSAWTHESCDNRCGLSSCMEEKQRIEFSLPFQNGFPSKTQTTKTDISVLNEGVSVESKCLIIHVFAIHEDEHSVQRVDTIFSRSNCKESADLSNQTYEITLETIIKTNHSSPLLFQVRLRNNYLNWIYELYYRFSWPSSRWWHRREVQVPWARVFE